MSSNSFSFLVPPGVNYVKVIIALIDFSSSRCLDLGCTCDLQLCLFNFSEFWLEDTQSMFPIRIVAERTVPGETRLPHRPDTDWRARRRREDRRAQVELGWQSGKNFITTEFQTEKGANDTFKENCLNCISFNRLLHLESSWARQTRWLRRRLRVDENLLTGNSMISWSRTKNCFCSPLNCDSMLIGIN